MIPYKNVSSIEEVKEYPEIENSYAEVTVEYGGYLD